MKARKVGFAAFGFGIIVGAALAQDSVAVTGSQMESRLPPGPVDKVTEELRISERGAHHKTWERHTTFRTPSGSLVEESKVAFVELATGMHYLDPQGTWQESQEVIEPFPGGAVARQGATKVIFANNLNTIGAVDMELPDGQRLVMSVVGLGYYNTANGRAVLLGEVQDSVGQIVSSNEIIYPDAFRMVGGSRVSVRLRYTRLGLEQDILILDRLSTPEDVSPDLSSRTTKLQVITEIFSGPEPTKIARTLQLPGGLTQADQELDWGSMRMGLGRSFRLGEEGRDVGIGVGKEYLNLNGRRVIIEEIPIPAIGLELDELPLPAAPAVQPGGDSEGQQGAALKTVLRTAANRVSLPPRRMARNDRAPLQMASVNLPRRGLVLDWVTAASATDFSFLGNTTYYVSSTVNLSGTTTIEGGSVIKFANSSAAKLSLSGPLVCQTDPFRPAVLTSVYDNVSGEVISSGTPTTLNGVTYLVNTAAYDNSYRYLRFAYAGTAVSGSAFTNGFWHCQFLNGGTNILNSAYGKVSLHNILASRCETVVAGSCPLNGEQVTADLCNRFAATTVTNGVLTNSLLTAVTNLGNVTLYDSAQLSSGSGVYQGAAWGAYYLPGGSTNRNVGNTNLVASLATDLRRLTTYPPLVYSNQTITSALTLGPQAQRDTDLPDRGYHYDPLDYVFAGCTASNDVTFTQGTAVGWFRTTSGWNHAGHGIYLTDQKKATFDGRAEAPTYWVRANTVQESGNNSLTYGVGGITGWAWPTYANAPTVNARFLRCSMLGSEWSGHFRDDWGFLIINVQDCEFWGGSFCGYISTPSLTNCSLDRVTVGIQGGETPITFTMRNCTMRGGTVYSTRSGNGLTPLFMIRETAFDGTTFVTNASAATQADVDYNAYRTNGVKYPTVGANNVIVTNFDWRVGPLGWFYQGTTNLVDRGSRTASAAGLYHFTISTNLVSGLQVKEAGTQVDIGHHYVAVDSNGRPIDGDGDGLADYWEDQNGDGSYQSATETDWNTYNSQSGLGSSPGLTIFTPLR